MNRYHKAMLGMLCGGLITIGVGLGVGFSEFSTFHYTGVKLPADSIDRTQNFTLHLESETGPVYLIDRNRDDGLLADVATVLVSEDVPQGTLDCKLTYRTSGPKANIWNQAFIDADEEPREWVHFDWTYSNEMSRFMMQKEQALRDIKNREIGYYIEAQLTGAVITVNPLDSERVILE